MKKPLALHPDNNGEAGSLSGFSQEDDFTVMEIKVMKSPPRDGRVCSVVLRFRIIHPIVHPSAFSSISCREGSYNLHHHKHDFLAGLYASVVLDGQAPAHSHDLSLSS